MYSEEGFEWKIEIINSKSNRGSFKSALFDFDGTISLIRQGWRDVMIPYFIDILKNTPEAEDDQSIKEVVENFVDFLTGKQTIYQCMRLDEEIQLRGGNHVDPIEYKREYHKRLMEKIKHRIAGISSGSIDPHDMLVPGSMDFLKILKSYNINLYLASGTDEDYVIGEAKLLGITDYFDGGIYGAKDSYNLFSKSMVIREIIEKHQLTGHELVSFGDGYVEIENTKEVGGFAVGLATNEAERSGVDEWKRNRLIKAGADIIIPDFSQSHALQEYLFNERVESNAI